MLPYCELIPSHDVAQVLLKGIRSVIDAVGIGDSPVLEQIIYVIVVAAVAVILGYFIRKIIVLAARKIVSVKKSRWTGELLKAHIFDKCLMFISPVVFLALVPFAFDSESETLHVIMRVIFMYLTVTLGIGICAIITFAWNSYEKRINKNNHPLKGVLDVAKGIVWIIIIVICASIIIHKSPMALLGGLGAFAAVIMLIFKDTILGFVAGVQLSSNDMLRVGDWIVVPSTIANGVVVDVTLTVVKVQNWDNTIVMLPPYTLVSSSFQNWRGMSTSGVRQIDRSILIDNASITAATPALLDDISGKYPEMKEYIEMRQQERAQGKALVFNGGVAPVNGTIDTNLGLFRAYLCKYLLTHPAISTDNNVIVRLMNPTENGTPLDIYCFTNTTDWLAYEAIRSQIFEHISATAHDFGITLFNSTYHGQIKLDGRPETGDRRQETGDLRP